jgi:hypothetical protein
VRTLLTYVLAAFAAASVFVVAPIAASLVRGVADPSLALGTTLLALIVFTVIALIVCGPFWALTGLVIPSAWLNERPVMNVLRGLVSFPLLSVVVILIWGMLYGSQDAAGAATIALYFGVGVAPFAAVAFTIIGLVWGAVFWIRAPKPTAAGIAA